MVSIPISLSTIKKLIKMNYIGEQLFWGIAGNLAIYIAFAATLLSLFFFWQAKDEKPSFIRNIQLGQYFYLLHIIGIFIALLALLGALKGNCFEYQYVWQHSSSEMASKYVFSALWAGQEGSYLVWIFLQGFFSTFLLFRNRNMVRTIFPLISIVQLLLILEILGINLFGFTIGSSPFTLLRDTVENTQGTIFENAHYLSILRDGNGLNPLLENYWMVIHPPVLFAGYSLTLFPFVLVLGSMLFPNRYNGFKIAYPWLIASIFFLGTGLLLGGAWAYQSLTFGGFWAWDPVENASLLPWLLLIASLHSCFSVLKKGTISLQAFILTLSTYIFVIYASYLTRSGVLANSSAHAFTGNDKTIPLIILLFAALASTIYAGWKNRKQFTEEKLLFPERKLWIFLGVLVIGLSAFQVFITTSIPLINQIFGTSIAPPSNRELFYNSWQMPFASLVLLFIGLSFFPKERPRYEFWLRLFLIILVAVADYFINKTTEANWQMSLLRFGGVFTVMSVIIYGFKNFWKKNFGAWLSHLGFALFMLAVLFVFSGKKTLTDPLQSANGSENTVLIKNRTTQLSDFKVQYQNSHTIDDETSYKLAFTWLTDSSYQFELKPTVSHTSNMGFMMNPAIKHRIDGDVFVYLASNPEDTLTTLSDTTLEIAVKESISAYYYTLTLDSIKTVFNPNDIDLKSVDIKAFITLVSKNGKNKDSCLLRVRDNMITYKEAWIENQHVWVRLEQISPKEGHLLMRMVHYKPKHIVIKAHSFPNIILLWISAGLMLAGILWVLIKRI